MSRTPHPHQVTAITRMIARADWDNITDAINQAIEADRSGQLRADGYPTTTNGGHNTGPGDPTGNAVVARTDGAQTDEIHKLKLDMIKALDQVSEGTRTLITKTTQLKNARKKPPPEPAVCHSCRRAQLTRPPEHYSSVGGRLATEQHLCDPCYKFVAKTGQLPTTEQLTHHDRTGRWRQRVENLRIHKTAGR